MTTAIATSFTSYEHQISLAQKHLANLNKQIALQERELANIENQLNEFNLSYQEIVVVLMNQIDEINRKISRLRGSDETINENTEHSQNRYFSDDNDKHEPPQYKMDHRDETEEDEELKSLFRRAARLMHPDLSSTEAQRDIRTSFMTQANVAYEQNNKEALRDLIEEWNLQVEASLTNDPKTHLANLLNQIRKKQIHLDEIARKISSLQGSELFELYLRVQSARKQGRDLLKEMASSLVIRLEEVEAQLSILEVHAHGKRTQNSNNESH